MPIEVCRLLFSESLKKSEALRFLEKLKLKSTELLYNEEEIDNMLMSEDSSIPKLLWKENLTVKEAVEEGELNG